MSNPKITYLLGAGASALGMPTMFDIGERYNRFYELLSGPGREFVPSTDVLNNFGRFQATFLLGLRKYGSPDIFFRSKFLTKKNDERDDEIFKLLYTFYLLFEQSTKSIYVPTTDKNNRYYKIEKDMYERIDRRYFSLFASLIQKPSHTIPDYVKFISWNYDVQPELAHAELCNKSQINNDEFQVFPALNKKYDFPSDILNYPPLLKLNGTAGIINKENNRIQFADNIDDLNDKFIMKNIFPFYGDISKFNESSKGSSLYFSWENSDITTQTKKAAKQIIKNTDSLVIIGYSFPTFNRTTDKFLFGILHNRPLVKIYFQTNDQNGQGLCNLFAEIAKIDPKRVKLIPYVDQFYIPTEMNF
jgi:hypothetical protein